METREVIRQLSQRATNFITPELHHIVVAKLEVLLVLEKLELYSRYAREHLYKAGYFAAKYDGNDGGVHEHLAKTVHEGLDGVLAEIDEVKKRFQKVEDHKA